MRPSSLCWGVKPSFVSYVRSAGGLIRLGGQTFEAEDGFSFSIHSIETVGSGGRLYEGQPRYGRKG
ncbi:HtaA domain-containing protein [Streptomyces sp. ISL-100]|nr:HtaA domain-containing protein [Streptomyces sp. ISL-100]